MSVQKVFVDDNGLHFYVGLASDTKPMASTVPPGSKFVETDTGLMYMASAAGWFAPVSLVSTGIAPAAVDVRRARFNAVADMPADVTSNANVAGDLVKFNTFSPDCRRVQLIWHGGVSSFNGSTGAGPIAAGALVTINAADDSNAADRLTYTDLTGAGTSSLGVEDVFHVSPTFPFVEIQLSGALQRIDAIGIPIGVTPTNIIDTYLEVRALG